MGVQMVSERGGEDLVKGAITDAMKKAATLFGVGLELYGPDYGDNAQDTPRPAPTQQRPAERAQQAPPPAPVEKRYTAGEYERFIRAAWEMRREGTPYEDVVAHLRQFREYLTPDQFTDAKEELQRIKAYAPEGVTAQ